MEATYLKAIIHWLHLCGSVVLLGGMFFATFVVIPILKQRFPEHEVRQLLVPVVLRFRKVVKVILAVLVTTGLLSVIGLVRSSEAFLGSTAFWLLLVKLGAIGVIVAIFASAPHLTKYTTYCSMASAELGGACAQAPAPGNPGPREATAPARDIGPILHYIALSSGVLVLLCAKLLAYVA